MLHVRHSGAFQGSERSGPTASARTPPGPEVNGANTGRRGLRPEVWRDDPGTETTEKV